MKKDEIPQLSKSLKPHPGGFLSHVAKLKPAWWQDGPWIPKIHADNARTQLLISIAFIDSKQKTCLTTKLPILIDYVLFFFLPS